MIRYNYSQTLWAIRKLKEKNRDKLYLNAFCIRRIVAIVIHTKLIVRRLC